MNIRELMEWRRDCFFCHDELIVVPNLGNSSDDAVTQFHIENDCMIVKSRFLHLSIHIESGTVTDLQEDNLMSDDFLNNNHLKITCRCLSCKPRGYYYDYSGKISLSPILNKQEFVFREKVTVLNNWFYSQIRNNTGQWGTLKTFRKDDSIKPPKSKYQLSGDKITTPFFDLKKLTPEKLEHKLKTLIVFS